MALSEKQKEANKAARRTRQAAWRGRCRLAQQATDKALALVAATFAPEFARVLQDERNAEFAREVEIGAIRRQIAELEIRSSAVSSKHDLIIRAVRQDRHDLYNEKHAAEAEAKLKIDNEFPDLEGEARWSSAAWEAGLKKVESKKDVE